MPASPIASPNLDIVVLGSMNVDHFMKVGRFPMPGETVPASDLRISFGGKGANQAVAAARQGAAVGLAGCVGDDEMGRNYLKALADESVNTSLIKKRRKQTTGSAFITLDEEGENMIVVAAGANGTTGPSVVEGAAEMIRTAKALVTQFEVPISAVVAAIKLANEADITTIVNPSPLRPTFPWGEVEIDYLIVNEIEADEIFGFIPTQTEDHAMLRGVLNELRVGSAIVTRGSNPTLAFGVDEAFEVPVLAVLPVDTVGAGDAFAGCFAARLVKGQDMEMALRAANCAGALTTLGAGAQEPVPDMERVDQHIDQL